MSCDYLSLTDANGGRLSLSFFELALLWMDR